MRETLTPFRARNSSRSRPQKAETSSEQFARPAHRGGGPRRRAEQREGVRRGAGRGVRRAHPRGQSAPQREELPDYPAYLLGAQGEPTAADGRGRGEPAGVSGGPPGQRREQRMKKSRPPCGDGFLTKKERGRGPVQQITLRMSFSPPPAAYHLLDQSPDLRPRGPRILRRPQSYIPRTAWNKSQRPAFLSQKFLCPCIAIIPFNVRLT